MILKVIASSSKGNAYVLDNGRHQLLIECGVKVKEIKSALDFDFSRVIGCILSHEHSDHSNCISNLIYFGIDIYTSAGTYEALKIDLSHNTHVCKSMIPFEVGTYKIMPFDIEHDCPEPFGYLIIDTISKQRLLFVTDTKFIKYNFKNINHYLIECNYDDDTLYHNLQNGFLEAFRYNRIIESHMGLNTLVDAIKSHTGIPKTIALIHLSDQNVNVATVAARIFNEFGLTPNIADSGLTINLT